MQIEKIEIAVDKIIYNTQLIQNELGADFFDALVEHNIRYKQFIELSNSEDSISELEKNFEAIKELELTSEALRKAFQFVIIKGYQTTRIQANHALTPDSIGFIFTFLINQLMEKEALNILDFGSGTANLSQTIEFGLPSSKFGTLTGIENDPLLVELAASIADLTASQLKLKHMDAVQYQDKAMDVVISDLPVGYYPLDGISEQYQVSAKEGHTYAHHLLIENALRNLKAGGFAIFLAPLTLFDSEQSDLLVNWLKKSCYLQMVINLPSEAFRAEQVQKAIYLFEKPSDSNQQNELFIYQLMSLKSPEAIKDFMKMLKSWQAKRA
ncbi:MULTISPECIES: class I SAM-dependent methyltransferase [unclassified Enterococcus]|uniref:class I SAM-dependent methyltransferase n=1 Tax=unclassified Enterococcus TaxID=2608891 RepID=UPI0015548D78|nr:MULTISPECIES: class I SAM-dependent methyltransferase [unclassified Enterococcus]MBS7577273.1 class I SAM-dependent methyltransferase [Enterococcus sp. MMGLQ5-2]MBS7584634.1 class I SAM-dependent methyltransferase [Enterococcus sp. MMGLQ5-1]NPD12489.1 class I SAM-dependent methyltransferase [Enterococcus sp. MMGLQ5-1]NPD37107.1 class I SAM-dependent methyltransferase [Enterococcus sp. MMGLQ5-2]